MRRFAAVFAALAALTFASAANAAHIVDTFRLDTYDAGGSGLGFLDPYIGIITVTDYGSHLEIDAMLNTAVDGTSLGTDYEFRQAPDSNHNALVFGLDKTGAGLGDFSTNVSTTGLFRHSGTSFSAPPFNASTWNYAVDCTAATGSGSNAKDGCIKGYETPPSGGDKLNPTSIHLSVTGNKTIGGIDISDLAHTIYHPKNGDPKHVYDVYFAVDVVKGANCNGSCTGNVGASFWNQQSYAPEPGTWALLILGFGAVGADLRRRRARALADA
jgi:hypothetical protein